MINFDSFPSVFFFFFSFADFSQQCSSYNQTSGIHSSICLLAEVAQTEATGPKGPISDL